MYPNGYIRCMVTVQATEAFDKWMRRLRDTRARAVIAERIQRMAQGLPVDIKPIGSGVSELRIHHGPGYRVYFTRRGRQIIILLCAGDKDSQAPDILQAQKMAAQFPRGT
ncbi:putative addiction module killer protein [Stenotrophomonas sp. SORGH_AS 282]|nr:putative addiction module killer protein [Stenotrophomonas sp. SORGH_AS_0282]